MMTILFSIFIRDLKILFRDSRQIFLPVLIAIMTIILFAIGIRISHLNLSQVAPIILLISIIIPSLFSAKCLYRNDIADGTIDFLMLSCVPVEGLVLIKALTHWVVNALPVIIILPILQIMLGVGVDISIWAVFLITLILATLSVSLVTIMVQSIIASSNISHSLLAVIVLPLMIPIVILATNIMNAAILGDIIVWPLYLLGALLSALLPIAPIIGAAGLRNAVK